MSQQNSSTRVSSTQNSKQQLSTKQQAGLNALLAFAERLNSFQEQQFTCLVTQGENRITIKDEEDKIEEAVLFNYFREHDSEKMQDLCNFYPEEVLELFEIVKPVMLGAEGCGRRSKYCALDRFLITLSHWKHAQQFNKDGLDFGLDAGVANTLFRRTMKLIDEPLKEKLRT